MDNSSTPQKKYLHNVEEKVDAETSKTQKNNKIGYMISLY